MPDPTPPNIIDSLKALVEAQAEVQEYADGRPYIVLRQDLKLHEVEHLLDEPNRKRGLIQTLRLESFTRLVNEQKVASSRIFYCSGTVIAVINFHEPQTDVVTGAQWNDYRIVWPMGESTEYARWKEHCGKKLSQTVFGQFLEDNLQDVIEPKSTILLEMVRFFEAKQTVEFLRHERQDDGTVILNYQETLQAKNGQKGDFILPREFTISIPAFEKTGRMPLKARLRFSLDNGKLLLWYELVDLQRWRDAQIEDVLEKIKSATGLEPFWGVV